MKTSKNTRQSAPRATNNSSVASSISETIKTSRRRVELGTQIQTVNDDNGKIIAVEKASETQAHIPQQLGQILPWKNGKSRYALWFNGERIKLTGDKNGESAQMILVKEARHRGIPLEADMMALVPPETAPGMTGASQINIMSLAAMQHHAEAAAKFEDHHTRFNFLRELISDVCDGRLPAGLCTGGPGSGKTWEITNVIENIKGIPVFDHIDAAEHFMAKTLPKRYAVYVKGFCTKMNLYRALYLTQNSGAILLFDDADSIFANIDTHNLLKAAMDSTKVRRVSYGTSRAMKDEETGMEFETRIKDYKGSIIIITNEDPKEMDTAIKSRLDGARVSVYLTPAQMLERMEECMLGKSVLEQYDENTQMSALQFLKDHLEFYGPAYSLRTLAPICNIIDGGKRKGSPWQDRAEYTLYQMYTQLPDSARTIH